MSNFNGKESDLYEPMRAWLEQRLHDKYKKGYEIVTMDASQISLYRALEINGINSHYNTYMRRNQKKLEIFLKNMVQIHYKSIQNLYGI